MDSVWFGMKLGVAMIGVLMTGFLWRGIWRGKHVGEHKEAIAQALPLAHDDSQNVAADK